jgi:hypothetical protein
MIHRRVIAAMTLLLFLWLNTQASSDFFAGSRGFPFAYETWTDVIPSTHIRVWAMAADVLLAFGVLCIILGIRMRTRPSVLESISLIAFAAGFLWANSQMWFGITHMLQKAPWVDRGNESVVYGFPFAYHILVPSNVLRPWMLLVNLAIGVVVVFAIHHAFQRKAISNL